MSIEQSRFTLLGLNPNDIAVSIVLLILSLPVFLRWWKRAIWLVWPLEMVLLAFLIGTGSRGGVVALLSGGMIALILDWRAIWRRNGWALIGLGLVLGIGGGLMAFPKGCRIGTMDVSPDASAGRRLEVWSAIPAMLKSSPNGWGVGHASEAYEQWFQPADDPVVLKHLLSSHFTWLVEIGWPLRWFYIFAWIAVIGLTIPDRQFQFPAWGVAVWAAFFIALLFNAAGKWWNWPVPLLWLGSTLFLRCWRGMFPGPNFWFVSIVTSGIIVQIPFFWPQKHSPVPVHAWDGGNLVSIGEGMPVAAILSPDKAVLGTFYGQAIRTKWQPLGRDRGSVMVALQPDAAATKTLVGGVTYIFSGPNTPILNHWEPLIKPGPHDKLVLINCRTPPDDWIQLFQRIDYIHGEFYADPYYERWIGLVVKRSGVSVKDVPGDETFIADWPSYLGLVWNR